MIDICCMSYKNNTLSRKNNQRLRRANIVGEDHNPESQSIMKHLLFLAMTLAWQVGVANDTIYVFPKEGQDAEQTEQDKFGCHSWAVKETRFNPLAAAQPSSKSVSGLGAVDEPLLNCKAYGAGKGALGGAMSGYVTGAIVKGDKKRASNFGAITGAMSSAARKDQCKRENAARRQRNEQRRALAAESQQAQSGGTRGDYNSAYKTCLSAKGYATSE